MGFVGNKKKYWILPALYFIQYVLTDLKGEGLELRFQYSHKVNYNQIVWSEQ